MKRFLAAALSAALSVTILHAQTEEKKRLAEATTVIEEMMSAGDKAVPRSILEKAEGIAVFPSLLKGGLVVGGEHGRGVISVRDQKTGVWSAPGFLSINGGSFGAQIGAQAVDLILVINNQRGLEQLVGNQFKLGADLSVAAGPVGRDAAAATDIQMRAQILSYSRTRGLFAGVNVNGTTIRTDRDANEHFYGTAYRTGQIVFDHLGGSPEPAAAWTTALTRYATK